MRSDRQLDSMASSSQLSQHELTADQFTVEDLRIMIGQNIGLKHLIPVALGHLERDPLSEGDFYPGDLLKAVLAAEAAYFTSEPDLVRRLLNICAKAEDLIRAVSKQDAESPEDNHVFTATMLFRSNHAV